MKAAAFALARPDSVAGAIALLTENQGTARILAGGQSLGPMLNLRLARPAMLVQVDRIADLAGASSGAESVLIGACVTHAAIADGRVPDIGENILAQVAGAIAYRAVRNRGTIGGSLCHADPAADWVTVLTALDAIAIMRGADGITVLPVAHFITGAFRNALTATQMLYAVRVPKRDADSRWGFVKACRKPGDFAHAMAAVSVTSAGRRLVLGALGGKPLVLRDDAACADGAEAALRAVDGLDAVQRHMLLTTARRALAKAGA